MSPLSWPRINTSPGRHPFYLLQHRSSEGSNIIALRRNSADHQVLKAGLDPFSLLLLILPQRCHPQLAHGYLLHWACGGGSAGPVSHYPYGFGVVALCGGMCLCLLDPFVLRILDVLLLFFPLFLLPSVHESYGRLAPASLW